MSVGPRARRAAPLLAVVALAAVVAAAIALVPGLVTGHHAQPSPARTDGRSPTADPGGQVAARIGGAVLVRAAAGAPSRRTSPPPRTDPTAVARGETDLGLDLLRRAASGRNVTVCPAGLALTLAMLEHGARGRTAQEIATVLHTPGLGAAERGAAWHGLRAAWADAAHRDGITLETADALWQQRGYRLAPAFLAALGGYYDAGVWQADFAHDPRAAAQALDAWAAQHTHGRITHLFDPGTLDDSTRLVLADAVYLDAAWAVPFDPADTSGGSFTRADGSITTASYLNTDRVLRTGDTGSYQAVELPYRGGRFAALAVMPTAGTLSGFMRTLTAASLQTLAAGLRAGPAQLALPRFATSSTLDLNAALAELGMPTAFGPHADLTGTGSELRVQQVVQRTLLRVAEKGTEAAAVTGIGVRAGAVRLASTTLRFDRPFLFLVRDTVSGAVLFAAQVADPRF